MSYDNHVTVFRGVRITEDVGIFNTRMETFIRSFPTNPLIQSCAAYHQIDVADVNDEDLWEYLCDSGKVVYNEYLNSFFLGETLFSTDSENEWRDLAEFTDVTADMGEVTQLIAAYYSRLPIKNYLLMWTS